MANTPLQFGILSLSSLFAMVDPIASAPVFVELTKKRSDHRKQIAIRACLTAAIALGLFATAGGAIFGFFGITVPAFQIVGGLLFAMSAIRELQGATQHEKEGLASEDDPSVVPIGIPLIAGAGSISTVMVLSGQAREKSHQIALFSAIGIVLSFTLLTFMLAPKLVAKMSKSAQNVMSKVMGLLTAVIGVQFIINGGMAVLTELLRNAKI